MGGPKSTGGVVRFESVLDGELVAIATRRTRAGVQESADSSAMGTAPGTDGKGSDVPNASTAKARAASMNLVGLSLSGGGVRSAAFCLGALQGLHRRGVLPLIDYLSTVSGGGYAGAYLSSSALNSKSSDSRRTPAKVQPTGEKTPAFSNTMTGLFNKSLGTGSEQPQTIRKLISSGGFLLKKPFAGSDRTFFGMLLIWMFVGSGLVAATSLAAYAYRMLDAVPSRQFLAVLGIDDQLSLDLFPPLVMFLIYVLIWGLTYWLSMWGSAYRRSGSGSQGRLARWWLIGTIAVSLVALATLMGSGNITVDAVARLIGMKQSEWIRDRINSLYKLIVPLIVTGLLPWFFPKQLFQSGGREQSGLNQWIFRICSGALLCGVPFLLVAYFASEGIGGSQILMDDRLRLPQLKGWEHSPYAPFWLSLRGLHALETASEKQAAGALKKENQPHPRKATDEKRPNDERKLGQIWEWVNEGSLGDQTKNSKRIGQGGDPEKSSLFHDLAKLYGGITTYELKKDTPLERLTPGDEWSWPTSRLGLLERWYHLMEYSLGCGLGLDALDQYQFALILKQHQDIHNLKERIVFRMNQLLLRPDFYKHFPAVDDGHQGKKEVGSAQKQTKQVFLPPPGVALSSLSTPLKIEDWQERVRQLRREAEGLEETFCQDHQGSKRVRDTTLMAEIRNDPWTWASHFLPGKELFWPNPSRLSSEPKNGGKDDTPWLIELRPRWALLPESVKEEVSTDRPVLINSRVREELSFYPPSEYALADVQSSRAQNIDEDRKQAEEGLARAFSPSVRSKLAATQTDSFYIVKRWPQVHGSRDLEKLQNDNVHKTKSEYDKEVEWSILLPQAWRELPWRGPSVTTVRDVDRDLQQVLTTQSFKMRKMLEVNRKLLEAYFPGMIESRDARQFSYIVLERDQAARWGWFCWSLSCFVIVGLFLDLNFTSWHGFYAERIGSTWINPVAGVGPKIPLAQLRTVEEGLPYHLISGSLNPFEQRDGEHSSTELFLLSQLFAGAESTGYRSVAELQDDNYNLASAIAVSGGAVSPAHVKNPIQRVLLLLGNFRLGQWIENPGFRGARGTRRDWLGSNSVISPARLLFGWFHRQENRRFCFITDGGLTENLGIAPLIRRRCKVIFAVDAGQDGCFQFHDLAKVQRWMQVDDGVRLSWISPTDDLKLRAKTLDLQPESLSPVMQTVSGNTSASEKGTKTPRHSAADPFGRPLNPDAAQHYLIGRIEYPGYEQAKTKHERDTYTGYLVYMKSTVCADDPTELVNYQKANPFFPHDPTTDLNFSPDQFESYRHLGQYTVDSTLDALTTHSAAFLNRDLLIEAVNRRAESSTEPGSHGEHAEHLGNRSVINSGAEGMRTELEREKLIVLKDDDLWARKAAAHEFDRYPEIRDQIIESLVAQLDDDTKTAADKAHIVLLEFHGAALPTLRRDIENLDAETQIRRIMVIADILQEDFDITTVVFLMGWFEKQASSMVQVEIQKVLQRIPWDRYPDDPILRQRASSVLLFRTN